MLADGGEAIADLAVLRDQAEVFGPVASTATAWRLLAGIDSAALTRLRSARAAAREGGAEVAELTGMVDLADHPDGTRIIVRRERPHPGAQLSLFDLDEGMRHQVFLTDTPHGEGSLQHLEARHRAHVRVEDRIRCGKATGFGRFPSRHFAINAAWLELALTAVDLLAWAQDLLLADAHVGRNQRVRLAYAEPKKLRYRLLHAAARITRGGRRLHLRISAT